MRNGFGLAFAERSCGVAVSHSSSATSSVVSTNITCTMSCQLLLHFLMNRRHNFSREFTRGEKPTRRAKCEEIIHRNLFNKTSSQLASSREKFRQSRTILQSRTSSSSLSQSPRQGSSFRLWGARCKIATPIRERFHRCVGIINVLFYRTQTGGRIITTSLSECRRIHQQMPDLYPDGR
jgi:hypothetical protein